jgi:hypothetical protein
MRRIIYFDNLSLRCAIPAETFINYSVLLTKLETFIYNLYPVNGNCLYFCQGNNKKNWRKKVK